MLRLHSTITCMPCISKTHISVCIFEHNWPGVSSKNLFEGALGCQTSDEKVNSSALSKATQADAWPPSNCGRAAKSPAARHMRVVSRTPSRISTMPQCGKVTTGTSFATMVAAQDRVTEGTWQICNLFFHDGRRECEINRNRLYLAATYMSCVLVQA